LLWQALRPGGRPRLGDRFPVDRHDEVPIGRVDFHTLGSYLSSGLTAAAIARFL
jgi:hypothetical protein